MKRLRLRYLKGSPESENAPFRRVYFSTCLQDDGIDITKRFIYRTALRSHQHEYLQISDLNLCSRIAMAKIQRQMSGFKGMPQAYVSMA